MSDPTHDDFVWMRRLMRREWAARASMNCLCYVRKINVVSEAEWNAIIVEAETFIGKKVKDGSVFSTEFIEEIAIRHGFEEVGLFIPITILKGRLMDDHCPNQVEITGDFSTVMKRVAKYANDTGLTGAICLERDCERLFLHCSDPVSAVTLRLRFG